jgi:hypothetical protein
MPFLALLVAVLLGYALWSGKIKLAQLPPILLAAGGAFMALRGGWLIGIPAFLIGISWYRGLTWRLFGTRTDQSQEFDLSKARWLLGVSAKDDAERIRARHRLLISENHPDRGGSEERAMELNKARDVLLDDLSAKPR